MIKAVVQKASSTLDLDPQRSYEKIGLEDLIHLGALAAEDKEDLFRRIPRLGVLRDLVICVALCQGAAQHFVDGLNGIKDFDVWTFYARHPSVTYPARRLRSRDFGPSKFGHDPFDRHYRGRRVDMLGRSLPFDPGVNPTDAIHTYLRSPRTATAAHLAKKAVVLIEPADRLGEVVWISRPEA